MRIKNKAINPDSKKIAFTFDGKNILGIKGDTIASALIDCGIYSCRETDAGNKRGVFCGMGVCNECAVHVDGREGELACMTYITADMKVSTQGQYRKMPDVQPELPPEEVLVTDLLVIGAGPAGMSAAAVAAEAGQSVVMVDERGNSGGQYFKQPSNYFSVSERKLDKQFQMGRRLISRVSNPGITTLRGCTIWGAFGLQNIQVSNSSQRWRVESKNVLIATGAFEKGMPIPGWTLPGVMTTGAAQTLLRSYQVAMGSNVAISGNGPLNLQMAAELVKAGVNVVALAETSKPLGFRNAIRSAQLFYYSPRLFIDGIKYMFVLGRARVPFMQGAATTAFMGNDSVEQVRISKISPQGIPLPESHRDFDVDSAALGFGFEPSNEIARSLGCSHSFDSKANMLTANRDSFGRSSVPGVWIAGDSSGIAGAQVAMSEGVIAGYAMSLDNKYELSPTQVAEYDKALKTKKRHVEFQKILWRIFSGPNLHLQLSSQDTVICRCLSLTREEISADLQPDMRSAGALKRVNRAGMGKCQGRYCSNFSTQLISENTDEPLGEYSGYAPAVPYKPTAIGVIAYPATGEYRK